MRLLAAGHATSRRTSRRFFSQLYPNHFLTHHLRRFIVSDARQAHAYIREKFGVVLDAIVSVFPILRRLFLCSQAIRGGPGTLVERFGQLSSFLANFLAPPGFLFHFRITF